MEKNKIRDAFLLVLLLLISPILFASTDTTKNTSGGPHIIRDGDTLWDISSEYLRNPFLWPEIWKENKYIKNPDLIYPGNKLSIPGMLRAEDTTMAEEVKEIEPAVPSKGDKGEGQVVIGDEEEESISPQSKGSEMILEEERVLPDKTFEPKTGDLGTVDKGSMLQLTPEISKKVDDLLSVDYIIADGIDGGSILGSKDNRELLGKLDRVYIKPPKGEIPIVGDNYMVIRKMKRVIHPKTGKLLGNLIRNLGIIKVVEVNDDFVSADIVRSIDYITKGDRIILAGEAPEVRSNMAQGGIKLKGYIVETDYGKEANAQFDIVYIDIGRMEGVIPGDNFLIYREGGNIKGYSQGGEGLPAEIAVGRLKVLSSQENTSTALVVKSSDAIERGFIVEKVVE